MQEGHFVCYACRRTLCVSHFDERAGVCVACSGARAAPARAFRPGTGTAPQLPALAPPFSPGRTAEMPSAPHFDDPPEGDGGTDRTRPLPPFPRR